jgi:hypothetical protein
MVSFTTLGFMGDGSPDRTDALIWALTELFPRVVTSDGKIDSVTVRSLSRVPASKVQGP